MRLCVLAVLVIALAAAQAQAADLDRAAVDFRTPDDIKWVRNATGTNEQAVLFVVHYAGKVHYDGAKNEEPIIQVWGMGPATSTPVEKK